MKIFYPSVNDVINANKMAIELLRSNKSEKHQMLKSEKIIQYDGNVKKKAALLLQEINKKHIFASANKRTSFIIACDFLLANEGQVPLKKNLMMLDS